MMFRWVCALSLSHVPSEPDRLVRVVLARAAADPGARPPHQTPAGTAGGRRARGTVVQDDS